MNNPNNYPYEFSVVMAVYNVEKYLREAVDSLIAQSFGFQKIQLILVDDGSTDSSGKICDAFREKYRENVIVIHKKNEGVASARNEGLKLATGRFLNFMDSDDKMSRDSFRKVFDFFCAHEQETDVVAVPMYFFGVEKGPHNQNWKFDKGDRVIDLDVEPETTDMSCSASFFACRTKRMMNFDPRLVIAEDAKVIMTILAEKRTLGVVTGCKYYYRRKEQKTESLVQSSRNKYGWYFDYFSYYFDWVLQYYSEKLNRVPGFVQYGLMYDLQWRFLEQGNMNEVLSKEEQAAYVDRLHESISQIDGSFITSQKQLEEFHKYYLLSKKYGEGPVINKRNDDVLFCFKGGEIQRVSDQPVTIDFIRIEENHIRIEGIVHLHGLRDVKYSNISVSLSGGDAIVSCAISWREIDDQFCFDERAQVGMAFLGKVPYTKESLPMEIRISMNYHNSNIALCNINYGEFAPISKYLTSYYSRIGVVIRPDNGGLLITKKKPAESWKREILFLRELWMANQKGTRKAVPVRLVYHGLKYLKRRQLWLFSDRMIKAGDNGEALFQYIQNSISTKVKTCFLLSRTSPDYDRLNHMGKVVPLPSIRHKLLYLLCDVNISSHFDEINSHPFRGYNEGYRDLLADKSFIFLQHGITMNDVSMWLSRNRMNIKGFVTSSKAEYNAILEGAYGYQEKNIWLTGFPRYDKLVECGESGQQLITIMPTWRAYLLSGLNYSTGERDLEQLFFNSEYRAFYNSLLNHPKLLDSARRFGYKIAFFPHPTIQIHLDAFDHNNEVQFLGRDQNYTDVYRDSSLIITDYSSAVFDFAYMKKPVLYAQFDKDEFFSGKHICKQGYFDYENDGFGEVEYDLESTVTRIIEYMENGCKMKEQYRERVDRFFAYHDRNNCRRVYEKILQMED